METAADLEPWIARIVEPLRRGEPVRRELPGGGDLKIDHPLPYLLVHRASPGDDVTPRLLRGEASYLLWRDGPDGDAALSALVRELAATLSGEHGAVLVLEVWAARRQDTAFRIYGPETEAHSTLDALARSLGEFAAGRPGLAVDLEPGGARQPPAASELLSISESYDLGCLLLGLAVPPVYLQPGDQPGEEARAYPVFFREFRRGFSHALRKAIFDFVRLQTGATVASYQALGARTVDDAVWAADRALAEIGQSFDFLLLVSPVNEDEAWREFEASGFQRAPRFHYRLLPSDPDDLKRRLYAIDLEPIEDPSLRFLLSDKRAELDREASLLLDRNSPAFLYGSIALYHPVGDELLAAAEELLRDVPPERLPRRPLVDARQFHDRALEEIGYYRARHQGFDPSLQIRPDVGSLMVSRGNLLIPAHTRLHPCRVEALIQHEVGTHMLTYANGAAQPLWQLAYGLAGYDELQEGLGVLAEYLVGGLTPGRMRTLAARVVAARAAEAGAGFVETFRRLTVDFGLPQSAAFETTARAHHAGGHTRDAIYLRGLRCLLRYLAGGGDLELLYLGKMAEPHIPIIQELRDRGILHAPPLRPRFLEREDVARRLDAVRRGLPLTALVEEPAP